MSLYLHKVMFFLRKCYLCKYEKNEKMKNFLKIILSFLLAVWSVECVAQASGLIPEPRSVKPRNGAFTILTTTQITHYSSLRSSALYLAEWLPLAVCDYNAEAEGNIVLRENEKLDFEAYILDISERGITIDGGSAAGVHNGIETLLQLLPPQIYSRTQTIPIRVGCCRIEDSPLYGYRGFMLDVARTFMSVDEIKRFIENLAHHKINRLHLHLSDDEAWRIEILSHPDLAQKGGFRGGGTVVAARYGHSSQRYGGYYTQAQMREIVEFAAMRNIEIIPEIDLPGHSHTLARVMPEVLCGYEPDTQASLGYDTRDVLCVAKEENYHLLDDVFRELSEIFPSPYIHIGGDEVIASQWRRCPDCQALIRRLGKSDASELQEHFTRRVASILAKYGKRVAAWNEASESDALPQDALVYGWESVKACQKAATKGFQTVVMPGQWFYFDMKQSPREAGHDWAAIFDVRKTLSFNLSEQGFSAEQMQNVAGFEASFFSEIYLSQREAAYDHIYYMTYPRICALSEVAWSGNSDWSGFSERLRTSHYDRMAAMGINFRLSPPEVKYDEGALSATSDEGGTIYYNVVGDEQEYHYTTPIHTSTPEHYAFWVRRDEAFSPEAGVKGRFRELQPKVSITSSIAESERYPYSGAEGYGRIARTSRAADVGDWILYTFAEPVECRQMEIATGNKQLPRYIFNDGYLEVSYDGKEFEKVCDLVDGRGVVASPRRAIKAVRVVCTEQGNGARFVTVQAPKVYPRL